MIVKLETLLLLLLIIFLLYLVYNRCNNTCDRFSIGVIGKPMGELCSNTMECDDDLECIDYEDPGVHRCCKDIGHGVYRCKEQEIDELDTILDDLLAGNSTDLATQLEIDFKAAAAAAAADEMFPLAPESQGQSLVEKGYGCNNDNDCILGLSCRNLPYMNGSFCCSVILDPNTGILTEDCKIDNSTNKFN